MVTRRTTFKLYPSRQQEQLLHQWRRLHCLLFNAALADRKTSYQKLGQSVSYFDQQNRLPDFKEVWPEYKALGSHALQATLKRVDFAFQRFFKGLGRYPRFKGIRHYSGWTYPCKAGWKAHTTGKHGALSLSNLGQIPMRGQARTWGSPTTCTIVYRAGCWYASITVECEVQRSTGIEAVGVDFGCLTAIALSDGTKIENPRFEAKFHIKKVQRQLRRKQKYSRRWKKIQKRVAKLHRKVAQQRQNWVHQQATQIVRGNSLVATEKLETRNMTRKAKGKGKKQKAGLNRSILDVGWGMLRSAIAYKLAVRVACTKCVGGGSVGGGANPEGQALPDLPPVRASSEKIAGRASPSLSEVRLHNRPGCGGSTGDGGLGVGNPRPRRGETSST